ncbi:E3 ubiquitin-protein ligase TRIM21-like isoform X2 [Acanthochromis polyacanthus]|nr:E3 ubiquitin-protein ligase TRIM21-like isoform X2 [Acanthochromis polyacanthus]XP_051795170.1 E3 ubiquitin-protein ligase TRIM21-like isoform X2 [Acanthochromis polyacanthus]XP_051795171.1 E3 ubiquitin-protein ligase TRIM21-like isoform X2 [Acanthochromis polyacanthus]
MASSSSLLSEEQFLCPICLDVFTRPVSTPCGHNFCMSCITSYWDNASFSQCPVCKEQFQRRPDLKVNTFISELASQLVSLQVTDARVWSTDPQKVSSGGVVLCDICTDAQKEAVKSCLECQTSYCDVHLEPHHRAAGLKRHTLLEPLPSLDDRLCNEHSRVLVLFCRDDNTLLCDVCSSSCHARHNVVPVQRAYERMKDELENTEAKVQQMIQERFHKVQSMTESVKQSKTESEKVITNGVQDFTVLVSEIQKSQAELIRVVEEKQKAAERQADGFVSDMQREIKELQRTAVKLRELKQTTDQLRFLQSYSSTSLLPHTMDLSTVSANKHLEMQHFGKSLRKSASQLRVSLDEMNTEISRFSGGTAESDAATLRYMQQYEVNIVLDPDSAHPMLCLSNDGKQVRYNMGAGMWAGQFLNPNMFTSHLAVLGRRGFSSGRFYFEVCTGQKTEWCVGVATASIQRRGPLVRSSCCGLWAIWFLIDKFETFICPGVPVHMGKVGRVGVFVDYDKGEISFYDVENATPIYSFTECSFTEELFPYFNPCDNEFGSNLEPLTIVPVCHVE